MFSIEKIPLVIHCLKGHEKRKFEKKKKKNEKRKKRCPSKRNISLDEKKIVKGTEILSKDGLCKIQILDIPGWPLQN